MDVTFELLAGLVGDEIVVDAEQGVSVPLRISAAEPNPDGVPGGSIELTGPRVPGLTQGTFPLRHPAHGAGLLFLVPIAENSETRTYQAVFG